MKKKTNYISPFVMVLIVGLVISFINGDFKIGSYFQGLEVIDLEVLLDYLNLGLGFLAFGSVFVYLIVRAGRQEKDPGQLTKKDGEPVTEDGLDS